MGFHSFVLLTATVLLACVKCSSKATAATFPVQETAERPNRRFATRFLRSSEPTDGDDEARMLPMLNEAKSVYRTLQDRYRVWNWMVAQKMTDEEIIAKLKIKDNVLLYLESSNAQLLWEVARGFSKRRESSQNPLLKTLLTLHDGDEAALARTFYAASRSETELTKKAASNLLKLQYNEWQKDGKTVDKMVAAMREREDPGIFDDTNLKVLEGFIQSSGRVEDPRPVLVDALVKSFGGNRKFLEALLSPTTRPQHQNSDTLMDLENVLLEGWKTKKLRPEVVREEELGLTTVNDLSSPATTTFLKYVNQFNQNNEQEQYPLEELAQVHGVDPVATALFNVGKSEMEEYTEKFLRRRIHGWQSETHSNAHSSVTFQFINTIFRLMREDTVQATRTLATAKSV